jgi:hypothetical protein
MFEVRDYTGSASGLSIPQSGDAVVERRGKEKTIRGKAGVGLRPTQEGENEKRPGQGNIRALSGT